MVNMEKHANMVGRQAKHKEEDVCLKWRKSENVFRQARVGLFSNMILASDFPPTKQSS